MLSSVLYGIGNKHEMIFSDASQIAPFLILVTFGSDRDLKMNLIADSYTQFYRENW